MKRYKILINGRNLYKEIELPENLDQLKIGTTVACDVRLGEEFFFEAIELLFIKREDLWSLFCPDNLYLTLGNVRKLMTKQLSHGDLLEIKYQSSGNRAFTIEFLIDFNENRKYERCIDISQRDEIKIGCSGQQDIFIRSEFLQKDAICLKRQESRYILSIENTTYGVYINGKKAKSGDLLKNTDFLALSDFFFYLKDEKLWTQIRSDLVTSLAFTDSPKRAEYPKFNRNTRIKTLLSEEKIEILDPPANPQPPKNNLFTRLLPSFGMLISSAVMAYMGGTMIIFSAVSCAMGVVTSIAGIFEGKKDFKEKTADRIKKYNAYIEKKTKEIEGFREEERRDLEEIYISQEEETKRLFHFSADLFDRQKEDEDYLCLYLGKGELEAKRLVNYKKKEKLEIEDELQQLPEKIYEKYKDLQEAPIVCDLKKINALGIAGFEEYRFELFKNIVVDLAARQYFSDLEFFFVVEEEHKSKVDWLRFLPFAFNKTLGVRNIVCDDESKNLIFEHLYKELCIREERKSYEKNLIVFLYDEHGFKHHPISRFAEKAAQLGVTFIFFAESRSKLHQGCDYVISIKDEKSAELITSENKNKSILFQYPHLEEERARKIAELLAPVYTEEISLEASLIKNISLFELMKIYAVTDIDLEKRWENSQVMKSLAAPIGVSKTGVVSLDLHDKAHGPHGLVAGTTGSGKSEILQTYVLSMATLFHPYEVAFVIIDFKGGGMANQFKELPHLLGAITNIDGKAINRSLKSIKAELKKRQRLFTQADVNHIDKYIAKFKKGEVKTALPHLIIIVDEFAELKAEQPEFMQELISAARIGRSLGVHLILATQKPSGQVNDQIWSNSRFKLCLKVQSSEDSNEVIKSPLAAQIKEAGRAYLQVGNNEIFELFQSAYSGAAEKSDGVNVKEFTISGFTKSGKKVPIYCQKKEKKGAESASQLEAIVRHVAGYCQKAGILKLSEICLPPLAEYIEFQRNEKNDSVGYPVEIGIYDDPDNQYQGEYSVDLMNNNCMLIGSSPFGKTNMLQGMIRALAEKYSPEEVTLYIIDFASMVLKNFDNLAHVGGVVTASEDEKLKNLFKLLHTEIAKRKEHLLSVGVSSFAAYKEAGKRELPLIVLLIDNLTALKELYFKEDDEILSICREGLSVGISVVIANSQTSGIGYKYLSNFSERIAFYCNDSNEYNSLYDHCREKLDAIPGRCLIDIEKKHYECQSYTAFEGEREIDRIQSIKAFIDQINEKNQGKKAKRIPLIPALLTKEYMLKEFASSMQKNFLVVAGLDYASVAPYVLQFASTPLLAISGKEELGLYNWIAYVTSVLSIQYPKKTKLYVSDSVNKKLAFLKNFESTAAYSMLAEDAVSYVKEIESSLKKRYEALAAGKDDILEKEELLLLIVDNRDALDAICADAQALSAYKNIAGRYKNMGVSLLICIENVAIPYSAPEILKNIRDQKKTMYFGKLADFKVFDLPLAMLRGFKKEVEAGDGYMINESNCRKLKTAAVKGLK